MADVASRVGTIGTTNIRLAAWLDPEERYQRHYIPLNTRAESIIGDERVFSAEPGVRIWAIRSWAGGEGEDLWDPGLKTYRQADGIKAVDLGDGLELSRLVQATKDSGGSSDITDIQRLGYGLGSLWGLKSNNGYSWDQTNDRWNAGVSTGVTSSDATSLTDGDDTWMYSGHVDDTIRRWKSGSSQTHFASGTWSYDPVVRSFGGILYSLDGDDLYEIDKTVADTRTVRADLSGSSDTYLTTTPWSYGRMSLSDKGPIWLQRLDNGQTFIWEYNVALDAEERVGKLSVDFAFPYSIFFTQGFIFVGFRYANTHAESGDAYLYFQRGAQRGVAGPFRDGGTTASKPVLIAGMVGDDLIVSFDEKIWAYNLTDGGIHEIGAQATSGTPEDAITFGQEIFIAAMSDKVDRAERGTYVASGSLSTGRYDFDYPASRKQLLEALVVTDPLPASTSVTMDISVDGGSAITLTGTHDTNNQRRFVWTAPTGTSLVGYEFELIPNAATTNSSNTPTIRQLGATVAADSHRIEWVLAVDCSYLSHDDIDNLNALIGGGLVTFTDPWQNRESDTADSFVVRSEEIITPEVYSDETPTQVIGRLRLLSRDLVTGTGGS